MEIVLQLYFEAATATLPPQRLSQRHVPLGAEAPTAGREADGERKRTAGACVASSPDSDLEAFSHNPAHDVPPQPNSPPDNVFRLDRPTERALGPKRGQCPASDSRNNISSSPPTTYVFGTGTPVPSPQSQSFYRSYGSIFPTSLAYIVPSTRGCSPWRPDAVMSTTGRGRHSVLRIFKGRRERTGHHATCGALPAAGPYLRLSRFQGGQAVKQKR
ncbi:hypothetical protein CQW23_33216 [Capsicum baccatum]|uniref:Protein TAR1 n=1 Tax=Capsicum baccatum TaxID=33114 RepID=A0A2G2V2P3_CAPBA|nr:hypothetical protein CQW23_33216 [Capsicum baccatum]